MTAGGPTKKQAALINRLITLDFSLNEVVERYLLAHSVTRISGMSVREASELIDILKRTQPSNTVKTASGGDNPSQKQLSFIQNLLTDEVRKSYLAKFLNARGKKVSDELSMIEASELISDLKSMPAMNAGRMDGRPLTSKQLKFITDMQNKDKNSETVLGYLKKARKGSVEELLSWEASELITTLKSNNP